MFSNNSIKWVGLLGSIATGITLIVNGNLETGVGIIAASLSSAGVLKPQS